MKQNSSLLLKVFIFILLAAAGIPALAQVSSNRLLLEVVIFVSEVLEHQPVQVTAAVHNTGDRNLAMTAKLYAAAGTQPAELIGEQGVSLAAGHKQVLKFVWFPISAGEHTLEIQLAGENLPVEEHTAQMIVLVEPSGGPAILRAWQLTRPASPWLAVLMLAGIGLGAAALALYLFQGRC